MDKEGAQIDSKRLHLRKSDVHSYLGLNQALDTV